MTRLNQICKFCIVSIFILFISFSMVSCNEPNTHTYTEWYIHIEATCESDGLEKRICLDCDDVEERTISKLDHDDSEWITQIEATCQTEGKMIKRCSMCHKVTHTMFLEKTEHTYDNNWIEIQKPTESSAGRARRKCKHCDNYQYKELLFHN